MLKFVTKNIFYPLPNLLPIDRGITYTSNIKKMKKYFISTTVMLLAIIFCKAQTAAKAVYFELGGAGLASINYDMRFTKKENGIGGRVGIGGFSLGSKSNRFTAIFIPIGVNYIVGKDERNYFEFGGGITPVIVKNNNPNSSSNFESTFGHLDIGYRMQPKNGGFFFKAAITPVFNKDFFWPYYGAVSFGYRF